MGKIWHSFLLPSEIFTISPFSLTKKFQSLKILHPSLLWRVDFVIAVGTDYHEESQHEFDCVNFSFFKRLCSISEPCYIKFTSWNGKFGLFRVGTSSLNTSRSRLRGLGTVIYLFQNC